MTTIFGTEGIASSCGGAPISIVRQYIEQQQTPH
jgi:REP element-mobilizing transposase RayT